MEDLVRYDRAVREEAAVLRREGRTLRAISKRLGVPISALSDWVKAWPQSPAERAAVSRRNLHKARAAARAKGRCPIEPSARHFDGDVDAAMLRSAALGVAMGWFMGRGYMVSVPVDQAKYDLVVDAHDRLWRVQIKTTAYRRGAYWSVSATHRVYDSARRNNANGRLRSLPYTEKEADYVFVLTASDDVYLIPVVDLKTATIVLGPKYSKFKR